MFSLIVPLGSDRKLLLIVEVFGSGSAFSTLAEAGTICAAGITPSLYSAPVSGFCTAIPRFPARCVAVGTVAAVY